MTGAIPISDYSTLLFIDTMVVLEGEALESQPWHEIDPSGRILILVVPQVLKEVDKRKRDGRLQKHARAFNRLMMPAAETGLAQTIVKGPPDVDIHIVAPGKLNWDRWPDLDPDEPDARVVAQVLSARGFPLRRALFFSNDINPISMASRHGLRTRKMPESWLRQPKPSPHQNELNKYKARVKELEASEPELSAEVNFNCLSPFQHNRIAPLDKNAKNDLYFRIRSENPKISQGTSVFDQNYLSYDDDYDEKYDSYINNILPSFVGNMHLKLQRMYGQLPFILRVQNTGHIQAENLVLTIRAETGLVSRKWYVTSVPSAPRPRPFRSLSPRINYDDIIPLPPSPREVSVKDGLEGGRVLEVHCADFRHGREWMFEGIATIDPAGDDPFALTVSMTASNKKGVVTSKYSLPHIAQEKLVSDFFDLGKVRFIKETPFEKELQEAKETELFDRFDFDLMDDED